MTVTDPTADPSVPGTTTRPPLGLDAAGRRINPGLRLFSLTETSVCVGLGARGLWVDGLSSADRAYLARLAASEAHVHYDVGDGHLPPAHRCHELDHLLDSVLVEQEPYRLPGLQADVLAPDLADWSLAYSAHAGPALQRRAEAVVRVHGLGRAGAHAAQLLVAAGVGTLLLVDSAEIRAADTGVGLLSLPDLGKHRATTVARRLEQEHPQARVLTGAVDAAADITLIFADPAAGGPLNDPVVEGSSQLPVRFEDGRAVIGPLVLPGLTPCLSCSLEHPLASSAASAGTEITLAATAAGIAVMHALMVVDQVNVPVTVGHQIAIDLASGTTTVSAQQARPHCGCAGPDRQAGGSPAPRMSSTSGP